MSTKCVNHNHKDFINYISNIKENVHKLILATKVTVWRDKNPGNDEVFPEPEVLGFTSIKDNLLKDSSIQIDTDVKLDNKSLVDFFEPSETDDLAMISFDEDNNGIKSLDGETALTSANTVLLMNSINGWISEYIDLKNAGLSDNAISKRYINENLSDNLHAVRRDGTLAIYSDTEFAKNAYYYTKLKMKQSLDNLVNKYNTETSLTDVEKAQLKKNIKLLKWSLDNFGSFSSTGDANSVSVVSFHVKNSSVFDNDFKTLLDEEMSDDTSEDDDSNAEEKDSESDEAKGALRDGFVEFDGKLSVDKFASHRISNILGSLKTGNRNELGSPILFETDLVMNKIVSITENKVELERIFDALKKEYSKLRTKAETLNEDGVSAITEWEKERYKMITEFFNKLGNYDVDSLAVQKLWTEFANFANLTRTRRVVSDVKVVADPISDENKISVNSFIAGKVDDTIIKKTADKITYYASLMKQFQKDPDIISLITQLNTSGEISKELDRTLKADGQKRDLYYYLKSLNNVKVNATYNPLTKSKVIGGSIADQYRNDYIYFLRNFLDITDEAADDLLNDFFKKGKHKNLRSQLGEFILLNKAGFGLLINSTSGKETGYAKDFFVGKYNTDDLIKLFFDKKGSTVMDIPVINYMFANLSNITLSYTKDKKNFAINDSSNNIIFEHNLNSSLSQQVNTINNVENYDELIATPGFENFDVEKNSLLKSNILFRKLFAYSAEQGKFVRRTGSPLALNEINGLRVTNSEGIKGVSAAKANRAEDFLSQMTNASAGRYHNWQHADKSTQVTTYVDFETKTFHYLDYVADITKKNNIETVAGKIKNINPVNVLENAVEALFPKVENELERIKKFKSLTEAQKKELQYDFALIERGSKFLIFEGLLKNKTKELLITNGIKGNEELIKKELREALEKMNQSASNKIKASGLTFANSSYFDLKSIIETTFENSLDKLTSDIYDNYLRFFIYNSFIHKIESSTMLYGELGVYNHAKDDAFKRNAAISSGGVIFRTDKAMLKNLNTNRVRRGNYSKYDGTLTTAVLHEDNVVSKMYDKYLSYAIAYVKRSNSNLSPEAVEKIAKDLMKPYSKMAEADAQGWINIDSYRLLCESNGTWSDKQEDVYQKLIKKESVDFSKVLENFPPMKGQYFGTLKNSAVAESLKLPNGTAFHKYQLTPLIPELVEDKTMNDVYKMMAKQGVDYIVFKSGSKMSSNTVGGLKNDKLYDWKTGKVNESLKFTPNVIYTKFLKKQLEIKAKVKEEKVSFQTQMRKLSVLGLFDKGVPSDFEGSYDEFWKLSEEDKYKSSYNYRMYKNYFDSLKDYEKLLKEELLKEFEIVKGENGFTFNKEKVAKYLKDNVSRDKLPQYKLDYLNVDENGDFKFDLNIIPNSNKLNRLLTALVKNRTTKAKIHGKGFFQVSGVMMEGKERRGMISVDGRATTNDLAFYDLGEIAEGQALLDDLFNGSLSVIYRSKKTKDENGKEISKNNNIYFFTKKQFESVKDNKELKEKDGKYSYKGKEIIIAAREKDVEKYHTQLLKDNTPGIGSVKHNRATRSMEVEISLQGSYRKLLDLKDLSGKPIKVLNENGSVNYEQSLNNLNELIQNQEWLNTGKNRKFVTMIGPRIPTQGDNSVEIAQIKRFLHPSHGDIIIVPAEIVAKSGGDFDIDKITFSEYNISKNKDKSLSISSTGKTKDAKFNAILDNLINLYTHPSRLFSLIRPNGLDEFESHFETKVKQRKENLLGTYSATGTQYNNENFEGDGVTGTSVFTLESNSDKHMANKDGKDGIGIIATIITMNPIANSKGLTLNAEVSYKLKQLFGNRFNFIKSGNNELISLSHLTDVQGRNISEKLSQLANGYLDIAKESWVFDIGANLEMASAFAFLIEAGLPTEDIIKLMTSKEAELLATTISNKRSTLSFLFNKDTSSGLKVNIMEAFGLTNFIIPTKYGGKMFDEKKFYESPGNFELKSLLLAMDISDEYTEIKGNVNHDTKPSSDSADAIERIEELQNFVPQFFEPDPTMRVLYDSINKIYDITDLQANLFKDMFRSSKLFKEIIDSGLNNPDTKKKIGFDKESRKRWREYVPNAVATMVYQNRELAFRYDERLTEYESKYGDFTVEYNEDEKLPNYEKGGLPIKVNLENNKLIFNIAEMERAYKDLKKTKSDGSYGSFNWDIIGLDSKEFSLKPAVAKYFMGESKYEYTKFLMELAIIKSTKESIELSDISEAMINSKNIKYMFRHDTNNFANRFMKALLEEKYNDENFSVKYPFFDKFQLGTYDKNDPLYVLEIKDLTKDTMLADDYNAEIEKIMSDPKINPELMSLLYELPEVMFLQSNLSQYGKSNIFQFIDFGKIYPKLKKAMDSTVGVSMSAERLIVDGYVNNKRFRHGLKLIVENYSEERIDYNNDDDLFQELKQSGEQKVPNLFQGYKGGFDPKGKGTPEGDGKDKAMRQVADSFVVEVANANPSSSLTSLKTGSIIEQKGTKEHTAVRSSKNLADPGEIVMLARNGSLKGKPLLQETKDMIKFYHDDFNMEFVVGDMPNVDSQFIDYLQEIGAKFTIYHTGSESRIKVKPQQGNQSQTQREYTPEKITELKPNEVFVFGSNPLGINGNPQKYPNMSASMATANGWVQQGEIMDNRLSDSGKAWGITTVTGPGKKKSKTPEQIGKGIQDMLLYAKDHPELKFLVTKFGTENAGWDVATIKGLFEKLKNLIPDNVILPKEFEVRNQSQGNEKTEQPTGQDYAKQLQIDFGDMTDPDYNNDSNIEDHDSENNDKDPGCK